MHLNSTVGLIGIIWAIIASAALVYYWLRSTNLYSLLVEGANRFEELRRRAHDLETAIQVADDRIAQAKEGQKKAQAAADQQRERYEELSRKFDAKEHELRVVTEKLEGQKKHLERELAKSHAEYEHVTLQKKELSIELAEERELRNKESNDVKTTYEEKLRAATKDLLSTKQDFEKLQKKFQEVDPAEVRRVKRKIHDYERLYNSMKGLREMADERNRNWEIALRKLSEWILTEAAPTQSAMPKDVGPLVGMALQAIGTQLIDDSEVRPEDGMGLQGATETDSMAMAIEHDLPQAEGE